MITINDLKEKLKGVVAILATPQTNRGEVSKDKLEKHVDYIITEGLSKGSGAIVTTGSMGECAGLDWEERKDILKVTVDTANGRVPILAGSNGTNVNEIIEFALYAEEIGADGIMLMPPYYWEPTDETILRFYESVAKEINIGILIYNNFPIVRKDVAISLLIKLTEIDNVVGIKECTPSFFKFIDCVQALKGKITVLNGNGEFWEPFAKLANADGFSSGPINFMPNIVMDLWEKRNNGDFEGAMDIRLKIMPMLQFWGKMANKYGPSVEPSVIKNAAVLVGNHLSATSRSIVANINKDEIEELKVALKKINLL
jgi:dihydrodipicolinate synthase/N-acetylneuraminate lyase